ncbi:MAG: hypothetical protein U9O94_04135 [Nanoarchaeota archaeon]|nr:hypothetical protein [Nanoarchaeota archaeon]
MNLIELKQLEYNTTNIADDTTPTFNIESGYPIDTIRQYNNKLYKAYGAIYPLCDYYHDDTDPLVGEITYITATDVEVDSTAVICILDETIVYDKGTNKYYIFDNPASTIDNGDGTYTVSFSTQDPTTPVNFTEVTNYRNTKDIPQDGSLVWEDLGYTNKYKMLDGSLNSSTVYDGDIECSFIITKVNKVALFNISASSVRIVVDTPDGVTNYYDKTFQLYNKNGGTFYDYFFNDFEYSNKILIDIPLQIAIKISIYINGFAEGVDTKVGLLAIGRSTYIGDSLYGLKLGNLDFSKKITSSTGETFLEQGNYKRTTSVNVNTPSGLVDNVVNLLDKNRANPVIFETNKVHQTGNVFGIYNDYDMMIGNHTMSKLTLNLESLL